MISKTYNLIGSTENIVASRPSGGCNSRCSSPTDSRGFVLACAGGEVADRILRRSMQLLDLWVVAIQGAPTLQTVMVASRRRDDESWLIVTWSLICRSLAASLEPASQNPHLMFDSPTTLVDCPTQLTLIFILWYLYLSVVFHDKYQS